MYNSSPYGVYSQVAPISIEREAALQIDFCWFNIFLSEGVKPSSFFKENMIASASPHISTWCSVQIQTDGKHFKLSFIDETILH